MKTLKGFTNTELKQLLSISGYNMQYPTWENVTRPVLLRHVHKFFSPQDSHEILVKQGWRKN